MLTARRSRGVRRALALGLPGLLLVAALATVGPVADEARAAGTTAAPATTGAAAQAHNQARAQARNQDRTQARSSKLPWSSGVTPVNISGSEAAKFGRKRGARVDNIVVFPGRESWDTMLSTHWYQALPGYFDATRDDVVVSLPLWPATNSVASTGTDDQWRALGATIAAADPDAYVRLGWEMNLPGIYWAYRQGNKDAWVASFRRAVRLLQSTCPDCRIVWNPNHGDDRTGSRGGFLRVKKLVDVYAIDDYDIYPPITNAASRNLHLNDFGQLNESLAFARKHGKKFAVPEWGIACNGRGCQWRGNAGGDNPKYIRTYVEWFRAHARWLAFESYFEEPDPNVRSALYTRPIGPLAGQMYRRELSQAR